jgi:hypothetical protein
MRPGFFWERRRLSRILSTLDSLAVMGKPNPIRESRDQTKLKSLGTHPGLFAIEPP